MDKITIIGSGLSGPLLSIFLSKNKFNIELYEKRSDPRKNDLIEGRSINLAISHRGILALREAKVYDSIEKFLIPMRGRMIHDKNGELTYQPYSTNKHDFINSISRNELNKTLLSKAESSTGVNIHFNQELIDINNEYLTFTNKKINNSGYFIGADGFASNVRKYIDKYIANKSYSKPLGHGYKELNIAPCKNDDFQLEPDMLHIWPRGNFMLIALPNTDKSFTCTLFMPNIGKTSFESLDTKSKINNFLEQEFKDAFPLFNNPYKQFIQNPTGKLATLYSNQWTYDNFCLIGDAAHAIVPFFGQGMNASFEDCRLLAEKIKNKNKNLHNIINSFAKDRKVNTDAIAKMAVENYIEMRDSVAKKNFIDSQKIANVLFDKFPNKFIPRYNMVSFTSIPYNQVYKRGEIQKRIISKLDVNNIDLDYAEKLINEKLSDIKC